MLLKKHILKIFAITAAVMAAFFLVVCSKSTNRNTPQTVETVVIKSGMYYSQAEGSSECISLTDDGKIQFIGFDVKEKAEKYGYVLEEESLTYEDFERTFTSACGYHTFRDGDNNINIVAYIFGEGREVGLAVIYFPESNTILYDETEFICDNEGQE